MELHQSRNKTVQMCLHSEVARVVVYSAFTSPIKQVWLKLNWSYFLFQALCLGNTCFTHSGWWDGRGLWGTRAARWWYKVQKCPPKNLPLPQKHTWVEAQTHCNTKQEHQSFDDEWARWRLTEGEVSLVWQWQSVDVQIQQLSLYVKQSRFLCVSRGLNFMSDWKTTKNTHTHGPGEYDFKFSAFIWIFICPYVTKIRSKTINCSNILMFFL